MNDSNLFIFTSSRLMQPLVIHSLSRCRRCEQIHTRKQIVIRLSSTNWPIDSYLFSISTQLINKFFYNITDYLYFALFIFGRVILNSQLPLQKFLYFYYVVSLRLEFLTCTIQILEFPAPSKQNMTVFI